MIYGGRRSSEQTEDLNGSERDGKRHETRERPVVEKETETISTNAPMRSVAGCDLQPATHGCRATGAVVGEEVETGQALQTKFRVSLVSRRL